LQDREVELELARSVSGGLPLSVMVV
jgi:hypothetical protein